MKTFDVIYAILEAVLNCSAAMFLYVDFSSDQRLSRKTWILFPLCVAVLSSAGIFESSTLFSSVLSLGMIFLVSFVYRMTWFNRVIFSSFTFVLAGLADSIALIVLERIFLTTINTESIAAVRIMYLVWSKAILILCTLTVKVLKQNVFRKLMHLKVYMMVIIPVSIFTMYLIRSRIYIWRSYVFTEVFIVALALNVALILTVAIVFNMTGALRKSVEEETKLALLEKLLKQQEEQYNELSRYNKDILKMKHDHKNFLLGVLSDLDTGNYDDIHTCVRRELQTVEAFNDLPEGSGVIYLLVNHKAELAKEKGITLNCEYHDVKNIKLSPIDFAVMLGNALDNAIEATEKIECEEKREVSIIVKVHKEQIVVIIKNPYDGELDINNLRSTKKSAYHGFGILSIKNIVAQWNGTVNFTSEDGVFTTYIVINNHPADNS